MLIFHTLTVDKKLFNFGNVPWKVYVRLICGVTHILFIFILIHFMPIVEIINVGHSETLFFFSKTPLVLEISSISRLN